MNNVSSNFLMSTYATIRWKLVSHQELSQNGMRAGGHYHYGRLAGTLMCKTHERWDLEDSPHVCAKAPMFCDWSCAQVGIYAVPISASSRYSRSKFVSLALTVVTLYTAHVLLTLSGLMTDDDIIIMTSFYYFINNCHIWKIKENHSRKVLARGWQVWLSQKALGLTSAVFTHKATIRWKLVPHPRPHEILHPHANMKSQFAQNPVVFTVFPVYREELQFSRIFPENPVGLACMRNSGSNIAMHGWAVALKFYIQVPTCKELVPWRLMTISDDDPFVSELNFILRCCCQNYVLCGVNFCSFGAPYQSTWVQRSSHTLHIEESLYTVWVCTMNTLYM